MKMHVAVITFVAIGMVGGCTDVGTKQTIGGLTGAVAGGVIGNQFGGGTGNTVATAAGAVIGGMIGSEIGRALDEQDRQRAAAAQFRALEYNPPGQPQTWSNPDTGHRGQSVAGPRYTVNNATCREYSQTIYVDGQPEVLRGTACRQPDGSWRQV